MNTPSSSPSQAPEALTKAVMPEHIRAMINVLAQSSQEYLNYVQTSIRQMEACEKTRTDLSTDILGDLCQASRDMTAIIHQLKFFYDWTVPPGPEWHDHFLDQFYQFRKERVSFWLERGVYGVLALKRGGTMLELCCGDGYNTNHFYSPLVNRIIAVDFDSTAIRHASRYNSAPNIEYGLCDIRTEMPVGVFDNVVWDAAIEHFTEAEIASVMDAIKKRVSGGGILSGHTIVEKEDGEKHLHQHEREFRSLEDLAQFLTPHFSNVRVFETIHPTRHNLYFYASDSVLPFDEAWPHAIHRCSSEP